MKVTTVGIDLAKSVFSMHGIDEHGKAVLRRTVSRGKVREVVDAMKVQTVAGDPVEFNGRGQDRLRNEGPARRIVIMAGANTGNTGNRM